MFSLSSFKCRLARISIGFLLFFCVLVLPAERAAYAEFRRGDANADGEVNITDATLTLNALFVANEEFTCEDAVDANDSGRVEISDAVFLLNFLFAGGSEPPAPGPDACGADETEDRLGCVSHSACPPPPESVLPETVEESLEALGVDMNPSGDGGEPPLGDAHWTGRGDEILLLGVSNSFSSDGGTIEGNTTIAQMFPDPQNPDVYSAREFRSLNDWADSDLQSATATDMDGDGTEESTLR